MRPIDADALEKTLRDWIRDHWTEAFTGDDAASEFADMIEHAETIDANPTVHAHWIPCGERLPEEEEKSYWVCLDGGGQCQCRWTNNMYGLGANKWDKWGWHVMDKPQYSRVIAWMPLPEPYKAESEE